MTRNAKFVLNPLSQIIYWLKYEIGGTFMP